MAGVKEHVATSSPLKEFLKPASRPKANLASLLRLLTRFFIAYRIQHFQ